jgi:hypothetical protein
MSDSGAGATVCAQELERIVGRMQKIQRAIKASRQPPSMLELEELKSLGREYARVIERMGKPHGNDDLV